MAFTEAQIDAACAAWDRVWMGATYRAMTRRDALRAALEAAERVRQDEIAVATKEQQERLDDF
jgi:hypothetical protein